MACQLVRIHLSFQFPQSDDPFPERRIVLTRNNPCAKVGRTSKSKPNLSAAMDNCLLDNPVISRDHAEIFAEFDSEAVYVRDQGSRHGTFLNRERVQPNQPQLLASGNTLRFGTDIQRDSDLYPPPAAVVNIEFDGEVDETQPTSWPSQPSVGYRAPDPLGDSDGDSSDEEDIAAVRHAVRTLREAGFHRTAEIPTQRPNAEVDVEHSTNFSKPIIIDLEGDTSKTGRSEVIDLTGTGESQNNTHTLAQPENTPGSPVVSSSRERDEDEYIGASEGRVNGQRYTPIQANIDQSADISIDESGEEDNSVFRLDEITGNWPETEDSDQEVADMNEGSEYDLEPTDFREDWESGCSSVMRQLHRSFEQSRHGPDGALPDLRLGRTPEHRTPDFPRLGVMSSQGLLQEPRPTPLPILPSLTQVTSELPPGLDKYVELPPILRLKSRSDSSFFPASESRWSSEPGGAVDSVSEALNQAKIPPWRDPNHESRKMLGVHQDSTEVPDSTATWPASAIETVPSTQHEDTMESILPSHQVPSAMPDAQRSTDGMSLVSDTRFISPRPAETAEPVDTAVAEAEASDEPREDSFETGSMKRKADHISDLTTAEVMAEVITEVPAAEDTQEPMESLAMASEVPRHRPYKRLRSVAQAAGYVALGGAAASVAFVTTLIATAPSLT
ncbi:hypothetical protein SODALDRAFT_68682 [Sodiomyces alkalinus F11]|uniref:FHA domain-containing protein n=1 Tax=Sodiomyces alkalinus (strain CBS 110278 / VKM F-3762 / F11) TaxID=1314773 RepID=A0A3N2PLV1_SODAK|nr:hypothetical protein SODALDRAFT_68682 [Sodiomyces alkalinus F11]ROT35515.1 hypothetical protein SODALDRAFT_68682 [Sodiomyces alkalinus F11]